MIIGYISILIVSVSCILLGLLVLTRNARKISNIFFFLMTLAMSGWAIVSFFEDEVKTLAVAKMLVNIDFSLALLMAFFFYLFCFYFLEPYNNSKKYPIIGAVITLPIFIFSISGLVISDISFSNTAGLDYETGLVFYFYFAVILFLAISGIFFLYKKFKKSTGTAKAQSRYVLIGLFLSAFIALTTNLLLPRIMEDSPNITRLGIYSIIIFIGFTTYAIVKHRLMDIRMVVARSVAYSILLLILGGSYGAIIFFAQTFFFPEANYTFGYVALQIILALIMVFTFQPLRRWITRVTDKVFFKNQYDPEALLDTLAHTIGSTIVLIELIYKTLQLLMREMKITRGIFVVLNENGSVYNSQVAGYKESPKILPKDMEKLTKDGILLYDELEESSHHKTLLRKYDVSVAIPLKTENDVQGILLLGEKQSGDMYSQNDLKVFEIIAPEIGVAITNAKSFEKIEKFNVTLRQEIKKATHELEKKNEQLRELDKAKDEFISMASHQLRTPLTAIKGYLSMLLEGDAGEIKVSQYDFVNEAFSGANRMVGLINDLLNVSRMETGRFFIEPVEIDMEKVVEEEVKQLQHNAKEKKMKLTLKVKGKTPHVWADETKIRQVMMNFIDNAVYYTTEGEVSVTLEHDKTNVIFKVTDTGIGVPKEAQANLFTKFFRADNARHVRPDGTGLGIYLAKRVMDDHGGELIFHSVEGKGSTFGFKLPIKSKLKIKRVSAPEPRPGSHTAPPIGELAAGIGVNPATLEATQLEVGPTVTPGSPIATGDVVATKAAGIEAPLPDSADKKDLEETAKEVRDKTLVSKLK